MRNLKRALSLALAAVMVLGMMVVGAGAVSYDEFTDKDDIVNTEAVSVLNTLNVIVGKDTGAFDPTGIVTRGEMAKIICIMLNGGEEPVLGVKDKPSFSDIKGHWAEKYIEYCAGLNVIAGRGNGKFDPDATVTGSEAAKMFLTALGYDAKVFSFTGGDWSINVNTKANEPGVELYTRLKSLDPALGLTRDSTAQMAYNTLNAKVLKITPSKTLTTGEVVYEYIQDTTFLEAKFSITKYTGVMISNDTYGLGTTSGKGYSDVYIRTVNGEDYTLSGSPTFSSYIQTFRTTVDNDLLGQEVVVFEKKNITGEKVVVGDVFATERNTVASTFDLLYDGGDATKKDSAARFVKESGLKLVDDDAKAAQPGFTVTRYFLDNADVTTAADAKNVSNGAGNEFKLIDNNADGVTDYVLQTTYILAKVTSKDETAKVVTLSSGKQVDNTDIIGYDDFKQGDIVLYSVKNDVYDIAVAKTVEGDLSAYSKPATNPDGRPTNGTITVDGTAYAPAVVSNKTSFVTVLGRIDDTSFKLGGTYRLYMANGDYPVAAEEISSESNYALVTDSGVTVTGAFNGDAKIYTATVKLLLSDGTLGAYQLDLLSTANNYYNKFLGTAATKTISVPGGSITLNSTDNADKRQENMAFLLANSTNTNVASKYDAIEGTLVSVSISDTDKTAVIRPTTNGDTLSNQRTANAKIAQGVTYWTVGSNGYVMNSSTRFFCFEPGNTKDSPTVITGVQKIPSGGFAKDKVIDFDYDTNTKVVKAVYVNYSVEASSTHIYITDAPSVTNENGATVWAYRGVLADGTMTTLKSKSEATVGHAYSYKMDNYGYATLTLMPYLESTSVKADHAFTGMVTAINSEAVTLMDENGTTITVAIDNDQVKVWNVFNQITGEVAPQGALSENCVATMIFKSDSGNTKVEAVFINSLANTRNLHYWNGTDWVTEQHVAGESVKLDSITFSMPNYDVSAIPTANFEAKVGSAPTDAVICLGNLTLTANLTVASGKTVIVYGNLADASGDLLTVAAGGTVVVNGNVDFGFASVVAGKLQSTGKLTIGAVAVLNGGNISVDSMEIHTAVPTTNTNTVLNVSNNLKVDMAAVKLLGTNEVGSLTTTASATGFEMGKMTVNNDATLGADLTINQGYSLEVKGALAASGADVTVGSSTAGSLEVSGRTTLDALVVDVAESVVKLNEIFLLDTSSGFTLTDGVVTFKGDVNGLIKVIAAGTLNLEGKATIKGVTAATTVTAGGKLNLGTSAVLTLDNSTTAITMNGDSSTALFGVVGSRVIVTSTNAVTTSDGTSSGQSGSLFYNDAASSYALITSHTAAATYDFTTATKADGTILNGFIKQ